MHLVILSEWDKLLSVSQPRFFTSPNHEKALGRIELPISNSWVSPRAGVVSPSSRGSRRFLGSPGPGGGFAIRLVADQWPKMVLSDGEGHEDVEIGLGILISKRASLYGRSPISYDVDFFVKLFGFDGSAGVSLVDFRKMFFRGAAHGYIVQRQIADAVPNSTLRLTSDSLQGKDKLRLFNL